MNDTNLNVPFYLFLRFNDSYHKEAKVGSLHGDPDVMSLALVTLAKVKPNDGVGCRTCKRK